MKSVYKIGIFSLLVVVFSWLTGCQSDETPIQPVEPVEVSSYFGKWQPIEDQYIVVFKEDTRERLANARAFAGYEGLREIVREESQQILADHNLTTREPMQVYGSTIGGFTVRLDVDEKNELSTDSRIAYIEQDQFIPFAKPPWAGGGDDGGGTDPTQETPYGITRVNGGVSGASGTAWVIDTGVDLDHPDLNVDLAKSATFVSSGRDSKDADDNDGHGTHVAGTIAAIDNSIGVVGVAAGATVAAVKVLGPRGGSISDVIAGVDYVGANGQNGDVANMSLGGGFSQSLNDAVIAASGSVIFVIAAGNNGADANNYSPASANGTNIYTISAMDASDVWASFSNYGNPPVDYCAPGVSILSTYKDGGYATLSGTSMAAPHAAGVLLLGNAGTDGTVIGDPDGTSDPIIVN